MTTTRVLKSGARLSALLALCGWGVVLAGGAQIVPLGEPDKHGYLNHSVKCDNGAKKIVQCVGGVQRCGYAGDQTLASIVGSLCSGSAAAPEPAGEDSPMQTQADGLSP